MSRLDSDPRDDADRTLSVYLEPLVEDRRVLWIGRTSGGGPERLAHTARSVLVLDPEPPAARAEGRAKRPKGLRVSALRSGPLAFRAGSFDLAVVPDGRVFGTELASRVRDLRTVAGDDGVVAVGGGAEPERDADGGEPASRYEAVFDLLGAHFEVVRMVGQGPFAGYALADLGAGSGDGLVVDDSLLEEPPAPTRWLALGAQKELSIDRHALVRCSLEGVLGRLQAADAQPPAEAADKTAEARAPAEVAAAPAGGEAATVEADYERLEHALAEQARSARALDAEVRRRGTLVRDLIATLESPEPTGESNGHGRASHQPYPEDGGAVSDVGAAPRHGQDAVERALEAETARTEAELRADELRTQLASAQENAEIEQARLLGTIQGLRSRLAELEEIHAHAEARLGVAQTDAEHEQARAQELERQVAELNERLELEMMRARDADESRSSPGATSARSRELLALRGEIDGLRARLEDRERALAACRERAIPASDSAEARSEAPEPVNTAREAEPQADPSARDSLVTRLQMDLAEQERAAQECQHKLSELRGENERLREALVDASDKVDQYDKVAGKLEEQEKRARALESRAADHEAQVRVREAERNALVETLRDVRRILADVDVGGSSETRGSAPHEITAAGVEAPEVEEGGSAADIPPDEQRTEVEALREQVRARDREIADRDTLIRSLMAQVEERDERLGTLQRSAESAGGESRGAGEGPPEGTSREELERELAEVQEREARLRDELESERQARRAAEAERSAGRDHSEASDDEAQRLRDRLGERETEVAQMRNQIQGYERDLAAMRSACTEARQGLEELLSSATASGDPSTAERIGSLLRLLGRV